MTQRATPIERQAARRWPLIAGSTAVLLAIALGVLVAVRALDLPELDAEWMAEILEQRGLVWELPALVTSWLGGGWFGVLVVPLGVPLILVACRRPWAGAYFLVTSVASASLVQVLKQLFGRARPEQMLVPADLGSFPSGHVANAATIAVALALILWRAWVWFAGAAWVVLMALSRTYLGVHWLTDTVGGLLLGAGVAVIIWAPFSRRLAGEWRPPMRSDSVAL
jgi:membrane-associated phospholipid phosphatase